MRDLHKVTLDLFLLTVVTLPLARPAFANIGASSLQLSDVFLAVFYLAVLAGVISKRFHLTADARLVAGLLFIIALIVSLMFAEGTTLSSWLKLVALSSLVLLPWLIPQLITSDAHLERLVRAWMLGTIITTTVALFFICYFVIDRDIFINLGCGIGRLREYTAVTVPRVCVPLRNPNMLANYIAFGLPILVAGRALISRRIWMPAVACTMLIAIFTFSTGIGGIALAGGITWWVILRDRGGTVRMIGARVVLLSVIAIALLSAIVTTGHTVPQGFGHVALGGKDFHFLKGPRVHTWMSAARTMVENPVIGSGYGSLVARTPEDPTDWLTAPMLEPFRDPYSPRLAEAHNVWLSVGAQSGLLGVAGFVLLLAIVMRKASFRPRPGPSSLRYLPTAVLAGLIGGLLFHGNWGALEETRHLWVIMGMLATLSARKLPTTFRCGG